MDTSKSLVCKLTTAEMRTRKATVIAELRALVRQKAELKTGFQYTFDSGDHILDKLTDFIKTERLCCDFFTFQLIVDPEKILLTLTGPEGAKEFIKHEVEL